MDQCKKKEAASGLVRQGRCPPIKPTQTGEQAAGGGRRGRARARCGKHAGHAAALLAAGHRTLMPGMALAP